MLIQKLDLLSISQDDNFFLKALESYTHSLIQIANPSLMLVEESKKKKFLDRFLISIDFSDCSLLRGE
jgi:hypothetical protein